MNDTTMTEAEYEESIDAALAAQATREHGLHDNANEDECDCEMCQDE